MIEITVGEVSAVIAAVITALQFFLPTALALLIVGVLKDDMSAVSWSSISATIHGSYWASMLKADTATSRDVQASVKWLLRLGSVGLLIIAAAGIITPIGLYDTILPSTTLQEVSFPYVADNGPFGYGTPERSKLGFNRQCGVPTLTKCPGSDTIEDASAESISAEFPNGYDARIPADKIDLLQSGLKEQKQTVSSFFNVQYRSHAKQQDPDINNGSFFDTGSYRQLGTLILDGKIQAVEGLVVDLIDGRIAFRNHTLPSNIPLGATWQEDLLVMEPETHCIDTNLTIDFTLSGLNGTLGGDAKNPVLTDRGGFASIAQKLPQYNKTVPYINADLPGRAYQSAWFFNVLLAVYYNVTRPNPDVFGYLNSEVGKTFQIPETTLLPLDELAISSYDDMFSTFLANDNGTFTSDDSFPLWPNPFNVTRSNFTDILDECNGITARSKSNASSVGVGCGLVYGVPRLPNGETKLVYEQGTKLSMPLLSCASAVKVNVKTFSFRFNGTSGLQSLHIDSIENQSPASPPLFWGVENNSKLDLTIQDTSPLWGLVSSDTPESPSLTVVKNSHLYLPGYLGFFALLSETSSTNMPASDFPRDALASLYRGEVFDATNAYGGYSGKTSFAMYAQWQKLSATTNGTASIVNLIFTDLATNGLVGTRSWLPSSDQIPGTSNDLQKRQSTSTPQTTAQVPVRVFSRQIRYNWLYGVPAYIGVLLTGVVALATLVLLCTGRTSPSKMRSCLHATSAGRILSVFLYPGECDPQASTRSWIRGVGGKKVRIARPEYLPQASDAVLYPGKFPNTGATTYVGGLTGYETDFDPLIDQKTGTAVQMTPISSPMPPQQQNQGDTVHQQGYHPHQGYAQHFGANQGDGQLHANAGYPMGGFAR